MNELIEQYITHVDFPEVSGAEHLEMLQLRDKIFSIENSLTLADKHALATEDRRLIELASEFYDELARFINFEERRKSQQIPPSRWWWYLDVLAELPNELPSQSNARVAT